MIFNNIIKSSAMLKMNAEKPIFLADMCRVCMITSDFLKEAISYELTPKIVDMLNSFADLDVSDDNNITNIAITKPKVQRNLSTAYLTNNSVSCRYSIVDYANVLYELLFIQITLI